MSRRPQHPRGSARGKPFFRLRFGFLVIAILLSVFGVRLFQLQGLDPRAYAAMAAREGVVNVDLPADRGAIVDRSGVELASSVDGLMIVADPMLTRDDAPEIATYLADELGVDYFETLEKLRTAEGEEGDRYQRVARRIPASVAQATVAELEERGYEGFITERDPMRVYPARDVAANLLGFCGEDECLAGFERTFHDQLAGRDGEATYEVGGGQRIPLGDSTTVEPRDGEDLRLTIDRDVQWFTQRALRQAVRSAKADSGLAVVMDSRTGEILAWADDPTFDANKPLASRRRDLGSRAAQDPFEPGSVEKVLTAAALIDAGKVTPHTKVTIPPSPLFRSGWPIKDHFAHGVLHYTFAGVIARSSNIGTLLAADKLSDRRLHDYLTAFGLGRKTNVGVRGETAGQLPDASLWSQINHDTISFGQGLSVSAIQMVAAINTIANGGVRVSPSLIQGSATTDDGVDVGTDHTTYDRVISDQAAEQTMKIMELVPDPVDGIAPAAAVPGYRVAGKTGTAQVADRSGYSDNAYTVSFAGFAPSDDPRFTVYVVIRHPRNGGGGGANAGPVFSKVMSFLMRRYGVPPTDSPPSNYRIEWARESAR